MKAVQTKNENGNLHKNKLVIAEKENTCRNNNQGFGVTHQSGCIWLSHHRNFVVESSLRLTVPPPPFYVIKTNYLPI